MNNGAERAEKKINWKRWIIAAVMTAVLGYSVYSVVNNVADINRLKAQAAECQVQYEQQISDNDKIKAILNSDSKEEYIEQKAREKGYVKAGETVFYDISSSK